jgi:hypothetical protein
MRRINHLIVGIWAAAAGIAPLAAAELIPADHPYIQYFGRWDFSDPLAPAHGWPGVYIRTEFEGTSLGLRMADNAYYWNIFIDGERKTIFHGTQSGAASYTVVEGLPEGQHTLLLTKRNEYWWSKFTFNGLLLDEGASLLPPAAKPARKIEFIGDSFTSASGNEYSQTGTPPDPGPYTNIYEGFGPITARHFKAQYHMSSISGYGMAVDYKGDATGTIPYLFDRSVVYNSAIKWDFAAWQPDLVVVCLGLNDYSGFGGWSGPVSADNQALFKSRYHEFIARLNGLYPGAKILAFAAHLDLLQQLTSEVVAEQRAAGNASLFYGDFPSYPGGYVNGGHPNIATHYQIAGRLIAAIDSIKVWEPEMDITPPLFEATPPSEPFILYSTLYDLTVQTDSWATVRYSEQDLPFAQMEHTFTVTGRRLHTVQIPVEHGRSYSFYLRAMDEAGNAMTSSAMVRFSVDTTRAVYNWKEPAYDDGAWKRGGAPFGSAAGTANTLIAAVDAAYLRKTFTIDDLAAVAGAGILIKGSDGAIVYLNGEEIQRINMPADTQSAYSLFAVKPSALNTMVVLNKQNGLLNRLRQGENILAVEVHRSQANPWLAFDSQMSDNTNRFFYKLGAEWSCYDGGDAPADKVQEKWSGVEEDRAMPGAFLLAQNYPNPFNPVTTIRYYLAAAAPVRLTVYDLTGRRVATLADGMQQAGSYEVLFSPEGLASGIYFCRLEIPEQSAAAAGRSPQSIRMVYLK